MSADLAVTWWGHATCTVELGGVRVLTDPLLSDRLAHLRRLAPTPGEDAGEADVVLVSHLHPDHLHLPSLRRVDPRATLVVPRGAGRLVTAAGIDAARVREVGPGERIDVHGIDLVALAADHEPRRHVASRVSAPPLGFRLDDGVRSLWYPGDTGLTEEMRDVDPVDLALVPVGGWGPTLPPSHLGPGEAAVAVGRVGARHAVPVHYGTFWPAGMRRLRAYHRLFEEPGRRFVEQVTQRGATARVHLPAHGDRVDLAGPDA